MISMICKASSRLSDRQTVPAFRLVSAAIRSIEGHASPDLEFRCVAMQTPTANAARGTFGRPAKHRSSASLRALNAADFFLLDRLLGFRRGSRTTLPRLAVKSSSGLRFAFV